MPIARVTNSISRSVGTVSRLAKVHVISKAQALERLAEVDAILDMMQENDEIALLAERHELAWLLSDNG